MSPDQEATLLERFLHWERTQPDAVYLTQPLPDGQVVEYRWAEVGEQARRMAAHLASLALPQGSHIALLGGNSAHWIIADLAIWLAGHVSVPLYPTLNAETAAYIFEQCHPALLFVGKLDGKGDGWEAIRRVLPAGLPVVRLPLSPVQEGTAWDELVAAQPPLATPHLPRPGDLATIIYTSGSTGHPKGVMHSFGGLARYARGSQEFTGMNQTDRLLSYLPLAHVAERAFVEANSMNSGCQVFFSDRLETFGADLHRARPTVFISMPRLWTKFYQAVAPKATPGTPEANRQILTLLGLQDCRMAFTGSAPLPATIVEWYRSLGLELLDVYGMSENLAWSHYSRPGQVRIGYVGSALPGVDCRIAEDGEIQVRCETQMLGYYRQPALTAESMTADGYFKTGDRGELDEQGRLRITGRVKELFKTSKGKYVAPAPIEGRFQHAKVEAVCVTGPGHAQPFALLMPTLEGRRQMDDPQGRAQLREELEALLDRVNQTLEPHERLSCVVVVKEPWSADNGLLTPTMKIRRNLIEARYLEQAQRWAEAGQRIVFETD